MQNNPLFYFLPVLLLSLSNKGPKNTCIKVHGCPTKSYRSSPIHQHHPAVRNRLHLGHRSAPLVILSGSQSPPNFFFFKFQPGNLSLPLSGMKCKVAKRSGRWRNLDYSDRWVRRESSGVSLTAEWGPEPYTPAGGTAFHEVILG